VALCSVEQAQIEETSLLQNAGALAVDWQSCELQKIDYQ